MLSADNHRESNSLVTAQMGTTIQVRNTHRTCLQTGGRRFDSIRSTNKLLTSPKISMKSEDAHRDWSRLTGHLACHVAVSHSGEE